VVESGLVQAGILHAHLRCLATGTQREKVFSIEGAMAEKFNPYHEWLAIPLKDQPPNYYRLSMTSPIFA
jgi:hypothetical protein